MSENREYKSDTFSMLLEYPENALQVYNALNHSHYENAGDIQMKRLDKGISLSIRNDAAFLLSSELNIYEHQSTYNPNMPLRSLAYYLETIMPVFTEKDLYSRKKVEIPTPHFVVFYNGSEKRPAEETQKLSDLFQKPVEFPELEATVKVINLNPGENDEFLEHCPVLREYMIFIEMVRTNLANPDYANCAVKKAIDDCISQHILEEFFIKRRNEVEKMMTIDCTWERREKLIRKEEHEDGYNEGYDTGYDTGYDLCAKEKNAEFIRYLLLEGKNDDEIMKVTKCSEQELCDVKAQSNA